MIEKKWKVTIDNESQIVEAYYYEVRIIDGKEMAIFKDVDGEVVKTFYNADSIDYIEE